MPRPNRGPFVAPKPNQHGIYEIRWAEGGRTLRRSTGERNFQQAQKVLAEFITLKDRANGAPADLFVSTVLADYVVEHVESGTVRDPERIRHAVKPLDLHFGTMLPAEITAQDVDAYCRQRAAGKLGRKVQTATIRRELVCLVAALNHAAGRKRLRRDDVPEIKLPAHPPRKDVWLTPKQAKTLLEVARGADKLPSRAWLFIVIALETGARRRAIEALTWDQVDMARKVIRFLPDGEAQTKKRRPTVPMSAALHDALEPVYVARKTEWVLYHPGSVRRGTDTAFRKAGLDHINRHTLRHTFATWAVQDGVPLAKVGAMLGDTYRTTESYYVHHVPDHLRDVVDRERKW